MALSAIRNHSKNTVFLYFSDPIDDLVAAAALWRCHKQDIEMSADIFSGPGCGVRTLDKLECYLFPFELSTMHWPEISDVLKHLIFALNHPHTMERTGACFIGWLHHHDDRKSYDSPFFCHISMQNQQAEGPSRHPTVHIRSTSFICFFSWWCNIVTSARVHLRVFHA